MDYIGRARSAIVEDARIVLALPEKILSEATREKYDKLNLLMHEILRADDIALPFYQWTIIEEMDVNPNSPLFFPSPENLDQIKRAPHIDVILHTTKGDLAIALDQARTELTSLLETA